MKNFLQNINRHLSNVPGKRTRRKIVVFESDDWGSIRMPSLQTFRALQQAGLDLTSGSGAVYNQNDTLASAEDLESLFNTFRKIQNSFNKKPVFTAVSLTANPDFERIEASDFQEYHYEPFTQTLDRYDRSSAFDLWNEGREEGYFIPEFHGREHLNVGQWMRALQSGDKETHTAFEHRFWGFKPKVGFRYQSAFYLDQPEDIGLQQRAIREGIELFKKIHGSAPSFFVTPNGPINNTLHQTTTKKGIRFISGSRIQKESLGHGKTRTRIHWLGQKNKHGQRYITRNAFFEPNLEEKDWVNSCLKEINIAFQWHKPAIISSHRFNYIGGLNEANRTNGLQALEELLSSICKRWPEVEFMSTTEMGKSLFQKGDKKI